MAHSPFEGREPDNMLGLIRAREHLQSAAQRVETDEQRERLEVFERATRLTGMLFALSTQEATPERMDRVRSFFRERIENERDYYRSTLSPERFDELVDRLGSRRR